MTEYPEALIQKTAEAIYGYATCNDGYHLDQMYRNKAVATLKVLGFAPYVGSQYWRSAIHVEEYK